MSVPKGLYGMNQFAKATDSYTPINPALFLNSTNKEKFN